MDDKKLVALANVIYAHKGVTRKDEMAMIASSLLRAPENYSLNHIDTKMENEKIDEVAATKFRTPENETRFKEALSVTSALIRGTMRAYPVDKYVHEDNMKGFRDSGQIEMYKKRAKVGKFYTFIHKEPENE